MARWEIDNISDALDFECNRDIELRTVRNAKNLLLLRMGELPYDRQRGFNVSLLELPITLLNGDTLRREIDRVMKWEPDAEVISCEAKLLDDGQVRISCVIETDFDE